MLPSSSVLPDVTTINYTLEWSYLEDPSNTTFAGVPHIDVCRCGPTNTDLGHVYTRYRCWRPKIHFANADEELWVLQEPLGQVNLLRPGNSEELRRRKEVHQRAEPNAYLGKNLLLLSGPCPRGRYQAYATMQYLRCLTPQARQNIESLSLLIQPYEEDCSDDQGGRAYIDLARYIISELPAFTTLYLNIWGEETKVGSREFAMVLWKEGVRIAVNWDWKSGEREEYGDIEAFLKGIDEGVVKRRPALENKERSREASAGEPKGGELQLDSSAGTSSLSHPSSSNPHAHPRRQAANAIWEEVPQYQDGSSTEDDNMSNKTESIHDENYDAKPGDNTENCDDGQAPAQDATPPTPEQDERTEGEDDDDWSDTIMTPLSPANGEYGSWQLL